MVGFQSIGTIFQLISIALGSVVVIPSEVIAPKLYPGKDPIQSSRDFLLLANKNLQKNSSRINILDSSENGVRSSRNVFSSEDGFVRGALDAWVNHQHLILRPDDVWFSILVQMNFYMVKHAEDVRHLFVDHEGKQQIHVESDTIRGCLRKFPPEIQKRVKTGWLREWIFPNFTTTVPEDDHVTAGVLMMGLMKAYFEYSMRVTCGLPSITLEGEKSDWEKLLAKLNYLKEFGEEPTSYGTQLRPILSRFVRTFETPDHPEIRAFWADVVRQSSQRVGCGQVKTYINGWINGFHFWDDKGEKLSFNGRNGLNYDNVTYQVREIKNLPVGYATVPIQVSLGGPFMECELMAGVVGKKIVAGSPKGFEEAAKRVKTSLVVSGKEQSSLQPHAAWFLYTLGKKSRRNMISNRSIAGAENLEELFAETCPA